MRGLGRAKDVSYKDIDQFFVQLRTCNIDNRQRNKVLSAILWALIFRLSGEDNRPYKKCEMKGTRTLKETVTTAKKQRKSGRQALCLRQFLGCLGRSIRLGKFDSSIDLAI